MDSRVLKGALVDFGPGADVLSMKHSSDYSAIQFSCDKGQCNASHFAMYMFSLFQETVGLTRIHVITDPDAYPGIAHVQVKDPTFAARIKSKCDRHAKWIRQRKMSVRPVPVEMEYERSGDPPYMPAVKLDLLKDRYARLRIGSGPAAPECVICLTEAEDPYLTPCGHRYCRACFVSQCSSVTKQQIPIRCLGNSGECSRIFLLPEIKLLLEPDIFEQLLARSFAIYFKTIDTIRQCPTSHCDKTYRASTDGTVVTCLKCSTPICTTCHAPSHSGMTCAMYQSVGMKEYQSWGFTKDVKKCPRCRNLIEKVGGCEKVDCRCGANFCWKCMEVSDAKGHCRCWRDTWGAGISKEMDADKGKGGRYV